AAIGPKNVQLAAEIADGWLPIFFSPRHYQEVFGESVAAGFTRAGGGKSAATFDIAPAVPVALGDDIAACRNAIKPHLALYIGGMGAKGKNFYYDLVSRYGYEDAAATIQGFFLQGKKQEAAMAVPDALVDDVALCGPRARIAERLAIWRESPITTLNLMTTDITTIRTLAELI
ncbi:MAG: LLM class flavin-dependent oxidoreductase, partial [Caldilineaceae bacterium]|nr:LLM class flavin-dependent oxidoreductase [Caldilineaceae bacterium]